MKQFDVIVLGAGAAGLMCAARAGQRGRRVLLVDHARAPGEKIRISGGGRCNFTNIHAGPQNYISSNRHFAKSALARYTPRDFLDLVEQYRIDWHEKTLGQLFCEGSSKQIVSMLLDQCAAGKVDIRLQTSVSSVRKSDHGFRVSLGGETVLSDALVVATGGKSIPKMGATGFAYEIAGQFSVPVIEPRAGLVPFTLDPAMLETLKPLAGIGVPAELICNKTTFREALLFTHRGLSGPSVLQISSYWKPGDEVVARLLPEVPLRDLLHQAKRENGRQTSSTVLAQHMPRRLAQFFTEQAGMISALADMPDKALNKLADSIQNWHIRPAGTEGYRTAEVTLGGIDTSALSSKSMEVKSLPGLYFIGECVDVTGWLGGYNFQWAWASAVAAGDAV
ncbi:NAD(P)/FAD-dependent oxidoreductase [Martelella mediterranea]|uniref:NAD(P)/FAD-dependent oxidoreductase n=1 Tax=Martelella mediterranea TaxID=293089 RepID=A0A4R3NJ54_9HYPH|nr:NAD(P)/FAD-dependent oxidoreductase [Martelella mediterranea]TCT33109.1 hypothetical protein EDC90_103431 [Martelella mediterranea]